MFVCGVWLLSWSRHHQIVKKKAGKMHFFAAVLVWEDFSKTSWQFDGQKSIFAGTNFNEIIFGWQNPCHISKI